MFCHDILHRRNMHKRPGWLKALLALCLVAPCHCAARDWVGTVVDGASSDPVVGAIVVLRWVKPEDAQRQCTSAATTVTDSLGRFRISDRDDTDEIERHRWAVYARGYFPSAELIDGTLRVSSAPEGSPTRLPSLFNAFQFVPVCDHESVKALDGLAYALDRESEVLKIRWHFVRELRESERALAWSDIVRENDRIATDRFIAREREMTCQADVSTWKPADQFRHVAKCGRFSEAVALLDAGLKPDTMTNGGPLILSLFMDPQFPDRAKYLELLLSRGGDPNTVDSSGASLAHAAAASKDAESLRILAARGVDLERGTCEGKTPLSEAARFGNTEIARLLIQLGARVNWRGESRKLSCVTFGQVYFASWIMLTHGLPSEEPAVENRPEWPAEEPTMPPLSHALAAGKYETARLLLDAGADATLKGSMHGDPPIAFLFTSTSCSQRTAKRVAMAKALMRAGGNPAEKGFGGRSTLELGAASLSRCDGGAVVLDTLTHWRPGQD